VFVSACVLIYASVKESTIRLTGNLLSTTTGVMGGVVGVGGFVGVVPPVPASFLQLLITKTNNSKQIRACLKNINILK
jgi:hypothetical protein